jgi:hypothetical protein
MKLRFRKNSMRLRLNQREAAALAAGSVLEEKVYFPGDATMSYILESVEGDKPNASFHDGVIRVGAPQEQLRAWAANEAVGMYFDFPANGSALRVAIEKDLECLDAPEEERDPHAYPRSSNAVC